MRELKTIQNQLLTDIFSRQPTSEFEARGLEVYRANLRATASKALQITFPTVLELIGEELISHAAEELLVVSPPDTGDWAVWGAQLPYLLSTLPALADYPFVIDVAELDYHCHQIMRSANAAVDYQSLMLLNSHQPEMLHIACNPQLVLMASEYPIVEIRRAHTHPSKANSALLKSAMKSDTDQHFLTCYRDDLEVMVQSISRLEFEWLQALKNMSIGDALTAFRDTEFSFQQWLEKAIQTNLLHKIHFKTYRS